MTKKIRKAAKKRDTVAECNEKQAEATKLFAKAIRLSIEADWLLGHCLPEENIETMFRIFARSKDWRWLAASTFEHDEKEDEFITHAVDVSELIMSGLFFFGD